MVDRCATDEGAEEAAEVGYADSHGADGLGCFGGGGDAEGGEAVAQEEVGGAEVVREPAEAVFVGGEEVVDEGSVGAGASHGDEVAGGFALFGGEGDFAEGDGFGLAGELLERGLDGIQREVQVAGEDIGGA